MVEKERPVELMKQPMFCCKLMDQFLEDPKVPLNYYHIVREYGLKLYYSCAIQLIQYCPWCGCKLEEQLGDKYYEILEKEYGIDYPYENVPGEFKSDAWWKKRGL
jgi:transcription initiation factor IIE alpha subunit